MLELVQISVCKEAIDLSDLDVLNCDVLFGGAVEDDLIQDAEDDVDVVVDFEDGMFVVELWQDEVDEDRRQFL